jgi:hypothetical protein
MSYRVIEESVGKAPSFAITVGLREGYESSSKTHTIGRVIFLMESFLKSCAAERRPFLTGVVTTGEVVYAWPLETGGALSSHEPVAIFSGEKNPLYNSAMSDHQAVEWLLNLASHLGEELGQTRVYVVYDGHMRILQKDGAKHPTGK